jgi:outer membrane protein
MRRPIATRAAASFIALLGAVSSASPAAAEGSDVPRLRLDQCLDLALQANADVQSAAEEVKASEAERDGARGRFGPKVHADAYAHEWNSPFNIPFSLDPTKPPAAFPVRDQFEWQASVSATQPITGLLPILDAYKVRSLGVDIARIHRAATRRDTAFQVIESYYHLLQAERLVDVATASVDQLQAQLRQSNSFHANGVVSADDVLRAQLAVASAQQRLIAVRARVSLEQAHLAVLVGRPAGDIDVQPVDATTPADEALTLEQAQKTAETGRVELVEVDKRIEQAHKEVKIAWAHLAPRIDAVASYIHNEGSEFAQTNSAYVGGTLSWDLWDWGTTISGISEAKARVHQAELGRVKLSDQIHLEVQRAFLDLSTATEAGVVARASVASAEENFRLVKKRYEASAATSFDVIDAEGLLTQARGQLETTRYDQMIARAALRRAMGAGEEQLARP